MSTAGSNWISPVEQVLSGRLPYDKNQYSPFNPSGQRKYSNTFMNALRDFMELDDESKDLNEQEKAEQILEEPPKIERDEMTNQSLPYENDQYSPSNPQGRRKYTNQFLKAVCLSMKKELDERRAKRLEASTTELQYDNDQQYRPTTKIGHKRYSCRFLKAVGSSMTYDTEGQDLSSLLGQRTLFPWDLGVYDKMKRHSVESDNMEPSLNDSDKHKEPPVELKTVENPWRPEMADEKRKDITSGKLRPDRLAKMFRGYLNKLTPDNSEIILHQISILPLDANDAMNLANLLFEKAVYEPKYCPVYAKVCGHVLPIQDLIMAKCIEIMNREDPYDGLDIDALKQEIAQEDKTSRRLLLADNLYELMRQRRAKYLNTIKLVGELHKLGLVKLDVILKYIVKFTDTATSESIEFVCGLLSSVGPDLASSDVLTDFLEQLMITLRHYARSEVIGIKLDARVRFKLLDTLEMSENGWISRPYEEEPKKIEEIRREFESAHSASVQSSPANNRSAMDESMGLIKMLNL